MTKDEVFNTVKCSIQEILPDIDVNSIGINDSLKDLGANSIDRMDIIVCSMESLGIKVPMIEFGNAKNIQCLVDVLYGRSQD